MNEEYGSPAEDSKKTAFSIMTLNKSTFKTFASAFYPYRVIEFSDPIMFANDFLPNSTDGCLSNLRYLCCNLNEDKAKKNTAPLPTIMKLAEAINEWDELQALCRFELVIFLSSDYRYMLSGLITMPSQDIVWQKVDELVGGRLRGFEHSVMRRRFKRFGVAHGACIVIARPSRHRQTEITNMKMTFTKDG